MTVSQRIEAPGDVELPEALGACLAAWNAWRGERAFPAWRGVDLIDLPAALLPATAVVDVGAQPRTFVYRYWGSALTRLFGADYTGRPCGDLRPPEFRDVTIDGYEAVIERRAPLVFGRDYTTETKRRYHDLVLRLPLSNDGERITHVVSVVVVDAPQDTRLEDLLGSGTGEAGT